MGKLSVFVVVVSFGTTKNVKPMLRVEENIYSQQTSIPNYQNKLENVYIYSEWPIRTMDF